MSVFARREVGRKGWIDVAKGIAIYLVVWYHSSLYLSSIGMQGIPWVIKVPLELFPMPVFFVIAGMMAARSVSFSFGDLWRRRVLPMLYLYVVWSAIRFLFYLIPGIDGGLGDLSADSPLTLALILVWPSSSYWFLYALAIFTVVAWLLRRVPLWAQLGGAGVLAVVVSSGLVDTHNVGWNRVLGLLVFYLLGVHLSKRIADAVDRVSWWTVAAIAGLAAVAIGVMILFRGREILGLSFIGQVLVVAAGITFAQRIAPFRASAFLSDWGASSLHIYLLHLFVIVPAVAIVGVTGWIPLRWVGFLFQIALAVGAILVSLQLMRWTGRAKWLYLPPRSWTRTPAPRRPGGADKTIASRDQEPADGTPAPRDAHHAHTEEKK